MSVSMMIVVTGDECHSDDSRKKIEEDLIAENQRLRMEIEYLKKLDALVRKREQEEGKKRK